MDTTAMKTTMTAVALVLALGTSAYAQDVKVAPVAPTAPAAVTAPAVTTPAAKPADAAAKPVLAPETMLKVGAPVPATAPVTAPKVEAKPAVTPSTATAPAVTKTAAPSAAVAKLVNINTVSAADLEKLPKIGEARAKLIVAGRPYKSVDDLTAKKVIPQDAFDAIKTLVSVK